MKKVKKTTESKYVEFEPRDLDLVVALIPSTATEARYAIDVPAETSKFILPKR